MSWGALVQKFFRTRASKEEAKDRLLFVLAYDRTGFSADQMEALRKDILETISRHVAIDIEGVKIDFLQQNPTAVKIEAPVRRTRISVDEAKPVDTEKYQAVEGADQKM